MAIQSGSAVKPTMLAKTFERAADLLVSSVLVAFFAPVLVVLSAAVRLITRGPVFNRRLAVGKDGVLFWRLQFACRSPALMLSPTWRGACARAILRSSLYEFPLLVNVLRGDMALVGAPVQYVPAPGVFKLRRGFKAMQVRGVSTLAVDALARRPGFISWELLAASGISLTLDEARRRDQNRSLRQDFKLSGLLLSKGFWLP